MDSAAIQTKLTTILVADVAGYSVLMGRVLIAVTRPSVRSIRTGPSPPAGNTSMVWPWIAASLGSSTRVSSALCRALQKTTQSFERDLLARSQGQRRTAPDRAWWNPLERCLRCRNHQRLRRHREPRACGALRRAGPWSPVKCPPGRRGCSPSAGTPSLGNWGTTNGHWRRGIQPRARPSGYTVGRGRWPCAIVQQARGRPRHARAQPKSITARIKSACGNADEIRRLLRVLVWPITVLPAVLRFRPGQPPAPRLALALRLHDRCRFAHP